MTQPNGDQEDRDLKARLEKLSSTLKEKRSDPQGAARGESEANVTRTGQAMSLGFRVLAEFVAGVVVGALGADDIITTGAERLENEVFQGLHRWYTPSKVSRRQPRTNCWIVRNERGLMDVGLRPLGWSRHRA
jgi:hypothetical protein